MDSTPGPTAHKQTSSDRKQFRRLLGSRLPRVRSGKEVRVGDHSRKELGSFRVDCERLCRGLTKQTLFFWLGHRERDRHFESLTNPIRGKRLDFTRGRILRGRPGSGEAPFCGLANLWTAFQTSSSNHSPMGIFSRIRRREKKEKIPAHTNSCSRLLKLPAEAVS